MGPSWENGFKQSGSGETITEMEIATFFIYKVQSLFSLQMKNLNYTRYLSGGLLMGFLRNPILGNNKSARRLVQYGKKKEEVSVIIAIIFSHLKPQRSHILPPHTQTGTSVCSFTSDVCEGLFTPFSAVCLCSSGHSKQINAGGERSDGAALSPPCAAMQFVKTQNAIQTPDGLFWTNCTSTVVQISPQRGRFSLGRRRTSTS